MATSHSGRASIASSALDRKGLHQRDTAARVSALPAERLLDRKSLAKPGRLADMAVEEAGERVEMLLGGTAARPVCIPLGRAEQDRSSIQD